MENKLKQALIDIRDIAIKHNDCAECPLDDDCEELENCNQERFDAILKKVEELLKNVEV